MLSSVGYFAPGSKPAGFMIHASTSVPSAEVAVKRSAADSSRPERNDSPTRVRRRSPLLRPATSATNSSSSAVTSPAAKTSRPPAQSNPETTRSPPTASSGGREPSAATR